MDKSKYIAVTRGHAVIAGVSGDIGQAIARVLGANEVGVISGTYNSNKEVADKLAKELKEKWGVKHVYFAPVDVLSPEAWGAFFEDAVRATGMEINMGVYAVGKSPNKAPHDWTLEDRRKLYDLNVHGSTFFHLALSKRMKEKDVHGAIVLVTSSNGINSGAPYSHPYDGGKSAQWVEARSMAEEYAADGIRINGVPPGWVAGKMNDGPGGLTPEQRKEEEAKIWLRHVREDAFADPVEIALPVWFLLSTGASYITGQQLLPDGGFPGDA